MEEFEDSQLRDLQEVDGIVLRDVSWRTSSNR